MTHWEKHVKKWSACQGCAACETRKNVALLRGSVPCDVLFVGDAPGTREDSLGKPFIGPVGGLLDQIVLKAWGDLEGDVSTAFTYLTACKPQLKPGEKYSGPDEESVVACRERLVEVFDLCKPKLLVMVGPIAARRLKEMGGPALDVKSVEIIHPYAILTADQSQRPLAVKRCVDVLVSAAGEL